MIYFVVNGALTRTIGAITKIYYEAHTTYETAVPVADPYKYSTTAVPGTRVHLVNLERRYGTAV